MKKYLLLALLVPTFAQAGGSNIGSSGFTAAQVGRAKIQLTVTRNADGTATIHNPRAVDAQGRAHHIFVAWQCTTADECAKAYPSYAREGWSRENFDRFARLSGVAVPTEGANYLCRTYAHLPYARIGSSHLTSSAFDGALATLDSRGNIASLDRSGWYWAVKLECGR